MTAETRRPPSRTVHAESPADVAAEETAAGFGLKFELDADLRQVCWAIWANCRVLVS